MNKRQKVLFTTNIPVPYRIDFYNELGKYVDLTVTFERHSAKSRDAKWLGNKFLNFKGIFLKGHPIGDDIAFCPEIVQIVRKAKFDKIIVGIYYSPTGILLTQYLRLTHTSFIMTGDGGFVKKDNRLKYRIKRYLNRGASLYLITSEASKKVLAHYGIPEEKMKVYPFTSLWKKDILNEVVSDEQKKKLCQKLGIHEKNVILGVGRLFLFKGWQDLIAVANKLGNDCGIYIVGGKPEGTEFESYIGKIPANFHFIDFKQKEELKQYYLAADIFVLPSRQDVWGLVINESMAMGLPVITTYTTVAGLELIDNGVNGYLYKAGDTERLLSLLKRLLSDAQLQEAMGKSNLKKIASYTIENMARVCYQLISEGK